MSRRDLGGMAVIAGVWFAAVALVDPRGEFPIHDDWIYDVSTWTFVRTGQFHFPSVSVVSMRAQVLWGAVWTRLFGQSFEVLRASTLVLSLGALLLVHRLLLRAGAARWVSVLGALSLLFNPIFLWASCSYMTDVPYVFASVLSLYWFARGIEEERIGFVVAACAAVVVSWFIRQNGVINLFPPLAVLAVRRPRRWRLLAAVIVGCGALFGMLLLFKRDWLSSSPQMFLVHYQMWLESSFRLPEQVAVLFHYIVFNAVNCGLFFLPLTVPLIVLLLNGAPPSRRLDRRRPAAEGVAKAPRTPALLWLLAAIAALIAWRTIYLASNGYFVPYSALSLFSDILPGPVFVDFGVGPLTLYDTWQGQPYPFVMAHFARVLLTIIAAALAALLVWSVARARGNDILKLALGSAVFGTLMLFASGLYFDRYSLDSAWALAVVLPLILPWQKLMSRALAIAALVALALFSTLSIREYFAWNRARWTAYHDLRAAGVRDDQIEGGAEAEGLYELRDVSLSVARRGHPQRPYIIAFNVQPGYRVMARHPFTGFFGLRRGDVLVLRRER